uniref:Uncharacterized protein n=1 Tax=Caenorhabditis japonica TaxID=281687 RepID=A0A8R1E4G9_CAEJA
MIIQLTLDYGPGYVTDQLENNCKCESFACISGEHFKKYNQMDYAESAAQRQYEFWQEKVYNEGMEMGRRKS